MPPRADLDVLLAQVSWVRRLALQLSGHGHDAEDAAQTTLLRALRQPPREPQRAQGFLRRTLCNALQMQSRAARRRQVRERAVAQAADAASDDTAELVARAELHRELAGLVLALPEPQRELVLRHYFEGEDVSELATRTGISADAVRAHLRRARASLRAKLERRGGEAWRAFSLLLGQGTGTVGKGTAAATAGIMVMKGKLALVALAAVAVVASALLFAPPGTQATEVPAAPRAEAPPAAHATDAVTTGHQQRVAVTMPVILAGRLDGLHAALPWSSKLTLHASAESDGGPIAWHGEVTVAGADFNVELPDWARGAASMRLQFTAADPWYLPLDQSFAGFDARPLCVTVTPARVLLGSAVDEQGGPVARASVFVFAAAAGVPRAPCLATTECDASGCFRIRVAADVECLLVAVPPAAGAEDEGALVAAGILAAAAPGPGQLEPIVLPAAAFVTGVVSGSDGRPVASATVGLRLESLVALDGKHGIAWLRDGRVVQDQRAITSPSGYFRLPALRGRSGRVLLERLGAALPSRFASAKVVVPQDVQLRLEGLPVTIRVLADGKPAGRAFVEWRCSDYGGNFGTDERGELQLLAVEQGYRVRALAGQGKLASEWAEFAQGLPASLDLQLLPTVGELIHVRVDSTPALAMAWFHWEPREAGANRMDFTVSSEAGRFVMRVPAGKYRLRVMPISGQPSEYLLPCESEVSVPATEVTMAARFGGRLRLTVTDAKAAFLSGTCVLHTPLRTELTPHFLQVDHRRRGAFGDDGPALVREVLEPGSYEAVLDLGAAGVHRHTVAIKAGEVSDLRFRLQ